MCEYRHRMFTCNDVMLFNSKFLTLNLLHFRKDVQPVETDEEIKQVDQLTKSFEPNAKR